MTVYADVLFLVNLYVDFFLLWCDDRVLRLQTGVWRLLGGALTGALCSLACLLPGQPAWASFLWGGISAVLTAGAAFLPRPPRIFLQASLCLWGLSLLLAGLCLFLIQWAAPGNMAVVGHAVYLDLSPFFLFGGTVGAYGLFWLFQKLFRQEDLAGRTCRLLLEQGGKQVILWARADTGNTLREPFSGLPVIVCQAEALGDLAPPGWETLLQGELPEGNTLRLVPFDSVGGSGVLPAFRPERVCRLPEKKPLPCYVALWAQHFPAGEFQALYNPDQFPE